MLKLALVNLMSNAVKFTRTRPQARIEIGRADRKDDETVVFIAGAAADQIR
jgi:signal transduction histidine kinase